MAGVLGTIGEVEAAAKAAPGKMNHGSVGPGSTFHMSAELFKAVADVNILHIAYRGGGPDCVETISGQVNRSFSALAAAVPDVQACLPHTDRLIRRRVSKDDCAAVAVIHD